MKTSNLVRILLLTLVLCLSAVGCGAPAASPADSAAPAASSASSDAPAESPPAAPTATGTFLDDIEQGAKLTFWEMQWATATNAQGETYEDVTKRICDTFNSSNPYGIEVEYQIFGWKSYYETFLTAVASGTAPDFTTNAGTFPAQFGAMNAALSLDPLMEVWQAENNPILTEIDQLFWDYNKLDGVQYGVPFGLDPKLIFYRTDYWEEAGLTEADLPKTFDDFLRVGRILRDKFPDKVVLVTGGGGDTQVGHAANVLNALNRQGVVSIGADGAMSAAMNTEGQLEIYNFFKTCFDEGILSPGGGAYQSSDMQKMYQAGQAIIVLGQSGSYTLHSDLEAVSEVMPPFTGSVGAAEGGGRYACTVNSAMCFSQTESPNAARYFLKWWCEDAMEIALVDGCQNNFPIRESIKANPYYQSAPILSTTVEYLLSDPQLSVYPSATFYPAWGAIEGELLHGTAVSMIYAGSSVEEAVNSAQEKVQGALDEYAAQA